MTDSVSPFTVTHVYTVLQVGGIERLLARILPRLAARDRVRPRLLLTRRRGPLADELEATGVPVEVLPLRSGLRPARLRRLARRFRETGTALVQAHTRVPAKVSTVAARLAGVPALATVHNMNTIVGARHRVQEHLLGWLRAGIVCVSEAVRRDYLRATRVSPAKVHVLYNGIDVGAIARLPADRAGVRGELGLSPDALLLVYPARLVPQKDHALLLAAFASIAARHPRAHLLLAGDGPLAETLRERVRREGLSGRVHLLGVRDDVPRLLRAADLLILSSWKEGFSLALLEGLAAGLPALVTDVGGNREAMDGESTGRIVPAGDAGALARALDELLGNEPLRLRLGEAAARRAWRFDFDRIAAETEALYERILAASPGACS